MKRFQTLALAAAIAAAGISEVWARGGGRAGGGGGGGRPSIGGGGGGARPSIGGGGVSRPSFGGAASHTPSLSRPGGSPISRPSTPIASRPNMPNLGSGGSRPNMPNLGGGATRPNLPQLGGGTNRPNLPNTSGIRPNLPTAGGSRPNMPSLGGGTRPSLPSAGGSRPNLPSLGGGGSGGGNFTRPSQGQLSDFLGLPGGAGGGIANRPGAGGATTLPARPGAGGGGVADRFPNLPTRPGEGGGGTDNFPNLPNLPNRPGGGDRPNLPNLPNRPGEGGGGIANRPGIGNNTNIGNRINTGDINIGNRVVNRNTNINNIRNNWNNVGVNRPFGNNWWGRHPVTLPGWGWQAGWNRFPGNWAWRRATWASFGGWFAWNWAQPVAFNYGTNVVFQDNSVFIDGHQFATTEQFFEQASTIAAAVPEVADPAAVEWMPLGVFAIAEQDATDTGMVLQLAVSKEGIIAGTFYNQTLNVERPVEGTVDRTTQRAAWRFSDGQNTEIIMETGIVNLTEDESTALVHFGPDKAQIWMMIRLQEPAEEAK